MKTIAEKVCIALIVLVISLTGSTKALAQQEKPNLAAEEWVYNQVLLGKSADLAVRFPNPNDRIIRSSFLLRLLRDKNRQNIARFGINVSNAHVIDGLDLQYMEIPNRITMNYMTFDGFVSFCRAHFSESFLLSNSTFNSSVDFCAVKADKDLTLSQDTFYSSLNLGGANVAGSLNLNGDTFLNQSCKIDLSGVVVSKTLFLQETSFNGPAALNNMLVGEFFMANKAKFLKPDENISFDYAIVRGPAYFTEATFMGSASFGSASFGSYFLADKIKFDNPNKESTFDSMTVGWGMIMNEATFAGPARFAYLKVGQVLAADNIRFNSPTAIVSFRDIQVDQYASFKRAVFNGPMEFTFAHVEKDMAFNEAYFGNTALFFNLEVGEHLKIDKANFAGGADFSGLKTNNLFAADVSFTSPTEIANFNSMKIGDYIYFDRAIFAGPVDFTQTTVGKNFNATETRFTNPDKTAILSNMKIGGYLWLNQAIFDGPADFTYTEVGRAFTLNSAIFTNNTQAVTLSNAKIGGSLNADHPSFAGPLKLDHIQIGGELSLSNAKLTSDVNLFDTYSPNIKFTNITWPTEPGKIELRNLKYDTIEVHNDDSNALANYKNLLDRSIYSPEIYTQLQNNYEKMGYKDNADYIYLAYKARERDTALFRNTIYLHWWWSWFLEIFAMYGRSPFRPLLWFLLFISFGDLIFRKQEKMVALVENPRPYHSFVYSLDLFLPFSHLGLAHDWAPMPKRKFAHIYAFILNLLGWILIPIAILAITRILD